MSVAVQVVNGREQGTEEEELREAGGVANVAVGGAQAMDTKEEEEIAPISPREDVMSDSELDQSGAPKKKKFKAWKSIKKIFKKKKSSKGSESDSSRAPNKSKSKSTGELEIGGDEEGELNKRISMSEDSVFTPDKNTSAKDRNSYSLNTSNLADEISAKLKERASSSDDGYAQSSEDAMTMGDTTHDNSYVAPSDSSKTDSGIITTEDEDRVMSKPRISDRRWKSFTSIGVKDTHHVTAEMKRLKKDNPGDVDLDLIQTSKLLSSSAAKHRISVAPSNRRPSKKGRARTPQKRSSSRLDDAPSPIAEEPTTPSKSPAPFDLDNEEKGDTPKNEGVPVVIIESPSSEDLKISKDTTLEDGEEEEDEEPMILPTVPKEVIIIMKDDPKKEPEAEAKPTTPTTPEPPAMPVEEEAPESDVHASPPPTEMKKKEEVEKESSETEKDVEEIKKEEEDAAIVEERRLSVAASKALFEAKIPASEPVKSTSSNKAIVNGNGSPNTNVRRSSQPTETVPETKAEADTKLSEKEEKKDEEEAEKDEVAFSDKEENLEAEESKEEPVSLRDRISRYQSLATKNPVKGLTSHTPSRNSPTKQRPASTSNIENKDSPKKIAPKVPSKPSSTSSNKPSGSTATTTEPSRQSTNPTPSSSTQSSSSRKPLQPKIDRCMVCDKPVYPNEMSKFEGRVFHRTCQKCSECSRSLTLWNLDIAEDRLYCKQHGTVVKNNQLKEKLII